MFIIPYVLLEINDCIVKLLQCTEFFHWYDSVCFKIMTSIKKLVIFTQFHLVWQLCFDIQCMFKPRLGSKTFSNNFVFVLVLLRRNHFVKRISYLSIYAIKTHFRWDYVCLIKFCLYKTRQNGNIRRE